MPLNRKANNTKIALVMLAIMAMASVISIGTKALAQDTAVEAVQGGTGMDKIIKGTENWGHSKDISVSKFLTNIGKSTGIYKMIHQQTAEEIAQEKAEEAAKEAGAHD
ncbi:MAG: sodium ion-translocating decarboxylase subunit beta, partial [Treponema sp.]|nr:sodium ion-translocating decarboxylase subunit beta [Treponema sp.]